jgi:hypothetical protein
MQVDSNHYGPGFVDCRRDHLRGRTAGQFTALDAKTGKVLWHLILAD